MTLRLVLVSLVAALGLTIPGVPMIESWVASSQNWMNARFADWDTRNPPIADCVIVSDYYDGERLAPRPPISSIPAAPPAHASASQERSGVLSASETRHLPGKAPLVLAAYTTTPVRPVSFVRKLAVFEPIEVGETLCLGFAEELNRRSEGIHAAPLRVAPVSASHGTADLGRMASSMSHRITSLMVRWSKLAAALPPRMAGPLPPPKPINPLMVFENLYGGVAPGRTIIKEVKAKPVTPKAVVVQAKPVAPAVTAPLKAQVAAVRPVVTVAAGFGTMETSPSLYFSGELTLPAKPALTALVASTPAPAASPEPRSVPKVVAVAAAKATAVPASPKPTAAATAQPENDDLDIEVAGALLPLADGFSAISVTAVKPAPAPASKPRFEPLETGPEQPVGVAYELNRRSEGLHDSSPPLPAALSIAASPSPSSSTPRPTRELNRAVKLTRDAVYAWVNVFTGPALMTVTQSKDLPLGR